MTSMAFMTVLSGVMLSVPAAWRYSAALLCGCLIFSPDIMNKILPFEIKTFKGLLKYCLLSAILISVVLITINCF